MQSFEREICAQQSAAGLQQGGSGVQQSSAGLQQGGAGVQQSSAGLQQGGAGVLICGIDEAGRGPFAGPVVAGAVILNLSDPEKEILYLNDSKKLSEKRRESLYIEILQKAIAVGIGYSGAGTIDQINILQATYRAMRMAIANLRNTAFLTDKAARHEDGSIDVHDLVRRLVLFELPDSASSGGEASESSAAVVPEKFKDNESSESAAIVPDYILADAVHIPDIRIPQTGIIKGDAKSVSIAAGSIIAKVTRDHIMYEYDKLYPQYGFASHKGYGTAAHREAIRQYGMLSIHRRSFIH
ncbi:MAG: ribonuclease HII [Parasporobacterium sp.]|nr:ribonuclease HII [Parasporobacterium sp.]